MKELAMEKLELLINDLKLNQKKEKEEGKSYFNTDLFAIRVKEIYEILKERIEYLERSNNRREDTIIEQRQEISDLKDNWNKLKEYVGVEWYSYDNDSVEFEVAKDILNKIQELEKSDKCE